MESITRLVSESLARHGFDTPLDYRRLQWSRWFRCESVHSLLFVPSKPGVFALAEEIMELGAADAQACPEQAKRAEWVRPVERSSAGSERREPEAGSPRRMLAVTQFFEDDDMAFVLDRMLSSQNPMRARLISGRYFVRYVVIDDASQRRSICGALNQWISNSTIPSSGEKASAIGAHFATSLELTESNVTATAPLGIAALGCPAEQRSAASADKVSKQAAPFPSGF
jgi:hypothetical protein